MKTKKAAAAAVILIISIMITSCGPKLDAKAYLQAMLDLSYKGDSAKYVEMELGTAEDAALVFERGIDAEMAYFENRLNMSDGLKNDFRELFKEMYSKAKYTVGDAKKQEDGSYTVEILYERMKLFEQAIALYDKNVEALPEKWAGFEESPSQDEMLEDMAEVLRDALRTSIENVEYDKPGTLTIKISLVDNVYTPDTTDVAELEKALFDADYGLSEDKVTD